MNLRTSYFFISLLVLAACFKDSNTDASTPPNIVFLFADDYTYHAIRALGNHQIETPHLDRLVASGTVFTHAYNMGGWHGAICVASRSMIISGTSLWESQEVAKQWAHEDSTALHRTWGKMMEEAGYRTYMTGKWHIDAPVEKVFQTVRNKRHGGMPWDYWVGNDTIWGTLSTAYRQGKDLAPLLPLGYNRPVDETDTAWQAWDPLHKGYWEGGKHWSEVVRDDALAFIRQAAGREEPYFMYLAFNAPHDPRQAPREFLDKYPLGEVQIPANWLPEYPYADSIGNTPLLRDEALAPYPRTAHAIKTHIREYYAIISHLDAQIGGILEALEASGEIENTYIIFSADHGLSVGQHGLLGKQNLYDHSIRVPLIIRGPGIPAGGRIDTDVYLQDIMPTSLELAGVDIPDHIFFNSLLPLAKGEVAKGNYEQGVYGAYVDFQRMIRKDGYKLIIYPKVDKLMLFDMKNDSLEINDLSDDPQHQERIQSLFSDLVELQKEMNDPLDLSGMYRELVGTP